LARETLMSDKGLAIVGFAVIAVCMAAVAVILGRDYGVLLGLVFTGCILTVGIAVTHLVMLLVYKRLER
jgi:hypothetical protein